MPLTPCHGRLEVEQCADVAVVTFTDSALVEEAVVQAVGQQLLRLADQREPGCLLLNLSNVAYLSSTMLGKVIHLHQRLRERGRSLRLCNLPPLLAEIFKTTGLDQVVLVPPPAPDTPPAPTGAARPLAPRGPAQGPRVLLCDPSSARRERLLAALAAEFAVVPLADLESAARHCREETVAAVVLPLDWPGPAPDARSTAPVRHFLQGHGQHTAVLVYADLQRLGSAAYCQALEAGARQVFDEASATRGDDLRQQVRRVVCQGQAQDQDQERLAGQFAVHGLLGPSQALRLVFQRAVRASQLSDLPVLLLGESGTGKQRLAEAIHALDPKRCTRPLVAVNCSAINQLLAESDLFGHTRGAFSGASGERQGFFRAAHGGTLLLDEVGELPLELQPKLLRVLQEKHLCPVGADLEQQVDVRVIAATNRPLAQRVAAGQFRADLYHRLNVLPIEVPPLRERPEDVAVQARHFLGRAQAGREQGVADFSPRVLEVLTRLPWGGNSRQLENCVWEILAHKESGVRVEMEDLPHWVLQLGSSLTAAAPERSSPAAGPEADPLAGIVAQVCQGRLSLQQAVEGCERRILEAALAQHGGKRSRTAAALGVSVQTLHNKIKKYQLG